MYKIRKFIFCYITITASRGFLVVSGERASNCYNLILRFCLLHSLIKENFRFRKMFLSTNAILRAISCFALGRFASVEYQYGIESTYTMSKCGVKDAVWHTFSLLVDSLHIFHFNVLCLYIFSFVLGLVFYCIVLYMFAAIWRTQKT